VTSFLFQAFFHNIPISFLARFAKIEALASRISAYL